MGMCQNSPFIEITLATTVCGEGDFLFMRVPIHLPSSWLSEFIF